MLGLAAILLTLPALADEPPDDPARAAVSAPESAGPATAAPTGTEPSTFQAADPSKHKENLSGIPFLVGAYGAIWAGLFGYVVLIHRRATRLEADVERLRQDILRASGSRAP